MVSQVLMTDHIAGQRELFVNFKAAHGSILDLTEDFI